MLSSNGYWHFWWAYHCGRYGAKRLPSITLYTESLVGSAARGHYSHFASEETGLLRWVK